MTTTKTKVTPMMAQWQACKERAKQALLFFRLGDFYEAFHDDAAIMAQELDLTLTKRQEIPMCGVPAHSVQNYIDRLLAKGYKVAIANQVEDPKETKGLVKREITQVLTPGSVINSSILEEKANNYLLAITRVGQFFGLAYLDISTAEFCTVEIEKENDLLNLLYQLQPKEVLTTESFKKKHLKIFEEIDLKAITIFDEWRFSHEVATSFLTTHFKVHSLDGFGLKGMVSVINAAGALLAYVQEELSQDISQIKEVRSETLGQYLHIDRSALKNLEIVTSIQDGSTKNTLFDVLDDTLTSMGGRLLLKWIKHPLLDISKISERQKAVETLFLDREHLHQIRQTLRHVKDLERLIMKVSSKNTSPKDLIALKHSLKPLNFLKKLAQFLPLNKWIEPQDELVALLEQSLLEEPPAKLSDGNLFQEGFNLKLDELKAIKQDSKKYLADYQHKLKEQTGIKTLKIGYNRMFGYYIEVSKGQVSFVPESFERRQTLTNGERYITKELKDYEQKALTAEEKVSSIEACLFEGICDKILEKGDSILRSAHAIAHIDALQSLAFVGIENDYVKPIVDDGMELIIKEGRHPIIEAVHMKEAFTPNDTHIDGNAVKLKLITGPNMAGKSTYIRQVALIQLMAQIGSFVPAKKAHLGVIDQLFCRIGASDDLSKGQSTFMVEMTETAAILNHATHRSLVILDEIGRGTSTYDGIAIAWSVAEDLLSEEKSPKTLFATHYFELTKLEEKVQGAVNYHVSVHEGEEGIHFTRKIVRGSTDKVYGIHVAKLAGMPENVLLRAKEILNHLEKNANQKSAFEPPKTSSRGRRRPKSTSFKKEVQLTIFDHLM